MQDVNEKKKKLEFFVCVGSKNRCLAQKHSMTMDSGCKDSRLMEDNLISIHINQGPPNYKCMMTASRE